MSTKEPFYTPEHFAQEQTPPAKSPRGGLLLVSCNAGAYLARSVVDAYRKQLAAAGAESDFPYLEAVDFQFSDSETCVRLPEDVSGRDVFLFQTLLDPTTNGVRADDTAPSGQVDHNYMAFLIAARALREWGANHITAVLPYLAYARQDKPTEYRREPTTAKLMADLAIKAGIDRLITWDPHSASIHGFYDNVPVDNLPALPFFIEKYRPFQGRSDVVAVAPDTGASKLITHFARALDLDSAIASKYRPRPEQATISQIIGDFTGKRTAIVLDDMISSGGTVHAAIKMLVEEKGIEEVYLSVSHNLGMAIAQERLRELHDTYHLQQIAVTNSIPQLAQFAQQPFVSVHDLSDVFSRAINRIHYNQPISDSLSHSRKGIRQGSDDGR